MLNISPAGLPDTSRLDPLLYRGAEYTKIITTKGSSPFIYDDSAGIRKLRYQGVWYPIPELHYDAEDDVLMTFNSGAGFRISLVREKIDAFMIGNRRFRRIGDNGYYELVYDGNHAVLVKWQKILTRIGVEDPFYKTYRRVFVSVNSELVEVNGRKDIIRLLDKNTKDKMAQFKTGQLDFRKDLPGAAAAMMQWVDGSSHE